MCSPFHLASLFNPCCTLIRSGHRRQLGLWHIDKTDPVWVYVFKKTWYNHWVYVLWCTIILFTCNQNVEYSLLIFKYGVERVVQQLSNLDSVDRWKWRKSLCEQIQKCVQTLRVNNLETPRKKSVPILMQNKSLLSKSTWNHLKTTEQIAEKQCFLPIAFSFQVSPSPKNTPNGPLKLLHGTGPFGVG